MFWELEIHVLNKTFKKNWGVNKEQNTYDRITHIVLVHNPPLN